MSTTRAYWRYAIGQQVRWQGDRQVYTITSRRWVERQIIERVLLETSPLQRQRRKKDCPPGQHSCG